MYIKLMRHALSGANTGVQDTRKIPDHEVTILPEGIPLVRKRGEEIGADYLNGALVYSSPYKRARQTLRQVLIGAGLIKSEDEKPPFKLLEDVRLREVEHGYGGQKSVDKQKAMRDRIGYFWYQLERGESPVQAYDRVSGFLESFMREMQRKQKDRSLIVSHGLTIRVFVMRFFHLTVEQFDTIANPHNGDIITIGPRNEIENPQFTSSRWAVTGLRLRDPNQISTPTNKKGFLTWLKNLKNKIMQLRS